MTDIHTKGNVEHARIRHFTSILFRAVKFISGIKLGDDYTWECEKGLPFTVDCLYVS